MNENQEFEFLKEKIKEKPVNKKKLLRKTIMTASMAVVFGLVACITFLVLEPVFSNWLYPEEEAKIITLPEEEIIPEDMLLEEPTVSENMTESQNPAVEESQKSIIGETEAGTEGQADSEQGTEGETETEAIEITQYQALHSKLSEIAEEASKSMVTIIGVTSDADWFQNTYENKGYTSGFIFENTGEELLMIADAAQIQNAESIKIIFCDERQVNATIKKLNHTTGLAVLSVPLEEVSNFTKEKIAIAKLGKSNVPSVLGSPVIAIGSPLGYTGSISYGMITSMGTSIPMVDSDYKKLTTDILGAHNASGVFIDLKGQIIGMIRQTKQETGANNTLSAIGITELKGTMQKISKQQELSYVGIYSLDVTREANIELGVPLGAYVEEVEMGSPAMKAGIQSGDIIVKINDNFIASASKYVNILNHLKPNETAMITVMRQNKEEYQKMEIEITVGNLK